MEEHELVKKIRESDEKAFEILFRKYFQDALNYARFYISDRQLAEDIVQDIFLKIWNERKELNIRINFRGYLTKCVHNECIQFLRHEMVKQKHSRREHFKLQEAQIINRLFSETGLNRLFEKEIEELVNQAMVNLSEKTRSIYLMSRDHYLTNSQIAEKYNLTEKSIEYHITRALEMLRQELKDYLMS